MGVQQTLHCREVYQLVAWECRQPWGSWEDPDPQDPDAQMRGNRWRCMRSDALPAALLRRAVRTNESIAPCRCPHIIYVRKAIPPSSHHTREEVQSRSQSPCHVNSHLA